MYDGRLRLSREVAEEARSHFGEKVFETVIPRNVRLGEAPSHGRPVLLYDILSPGAVSYMKLAGEMIEREAGGPAPPEGTVVSEQTNVQEART
jgi:chromosome partitioning protein